MQPILEISFGKEQISLSEQQPEIFSMPKLGYNDRCLWLMVWGEREKKSRRKDMATNHATFHPTKRKNQI
jgi:hypothetical protein